ncbi:MAG: ribonuclease P protein component [Bdellovibrionales bacterium]
MENKQPTPVAALVSLKSPQSFLQLRQKGRRVIVAPWLVVYSKPNQQKKIRLGCTLPRYVGTAVTRNRLKRWCREHLRRWAAQIGDDETVDISLVFRRQQNEFYRQLSHKEIDAVLSKSLAKVA